MSFKRRPQGVAVAAFRAVRYVVYLVPDSRYQCWKRKLDYLAAALVHIWYRSSSCFFCENICNSNVNAKDTINS